MKGAFYFEFLYKDFLIHSRIPIDCKKKEKSMKIQAEVPCNTIVLQQAIESFKVLHPGLGAIAQKNSEIILSNGNIIVKVESLCPIHHSSSRF